MEKFLSENEAIQGVQLGFGLRTSQGESSQSREDLERENSMLKVLYRKLSKEVQEFVDKKGLQN